ncbi:MULTISPECIES: flavodoxin [Fusobacterium]|uniref:flavodoxin n=1 Tax=Fusobacterium TaxID=848 RepID=UPI0004488C19|nr:MULTISPECIES: flavodoxin [Fusobacterium]EUB33406.1 flavodoxin [Fusobacterium sp. OBRC1]WRL72530.1 flavodoxin [Fusobacterium polymorphum]
MNKKLVVYFSHKGENYSKGRIVNLEKGKTEIAAEMISNILNADIFEIVAEKEYPFNYNECIEIAKKELRENSKIKLKQDIDIKDYDTIFVGYPNWWGTMPMPVWTFLEEKDFTNKKVLPFCTHEGSGLGKSESDIKKLIGDAEVLKGLAINGSEVNNSEKQIKKWLEDSLK